MVNIFTD